MANIPGGNGSAIYPYFLHPTAVDLTGLEHRFITFVAGGIVISGAGTPFAALLSLQLKAGPIQYGAFIAVIALPFTIISGAAFGAGVPIESDALGAAVPAAPGPLLAGGCLSIEAASGPGQLVLAQFAFKP